MDAFKEFLSTYPPSVQALARKAKMLVQGTIPDATEYVDATSKIVAYGLALNTLTWSAQSHRTKHMLT